MTWENLAAEAERDYGEAWLPHKNPEHPKTLVGTVLGYDQGPVSVYSGEKPWIATIGDRDDKAWCVWLNAAVLVSEFERKRPMPGEQVAIAYKGVADRASQPGMAAPHLYRVVVKRDNALPPFMAAGELGPGDDGMVRRDVQKTGESDLGAADTEGFVYGRAPAKEEPVADADVVDGTADDDDDPIPF